MAQEMPHDSINFCIPATRLLVRKSASVSEACEHETMFNSLRDGFISAKPGDRTNRAWDKQKPVRVAAGLPRQSLCQKRGDSDPGEIVIAKRRMAAMRGNQNLFLRLSW